jgi:hypothetical protein
MHTWIVDIATKLLRRKKNSAFVEIATNKCGNIDEQPSQIWSYVLVTMLRGCSLQKITSYLQKLQNNKSNHRISCTITHKIYNLKNDRLQQQANQLSNCVCAGCQRIKASYQQFIIVMRSSSIYQHIIIITSKINKDLRRFRRLSTNVDNITKDDPHS